VAIELTSAKVSKTITETMTPFTLAFRVEWLVEGVPVTASTHLGSSTGLLGVLERILSSRRIVDQGNGVHTAILTRSMGEGEEA